MAEVTMASLAIEFERRKHQQADGVRDLKALCLRYGGPSGSDWGVLLTWLDRQLELADKAYGFDFDEGAIAELEAEEAVSVKPTFAGIDLKAGIADGTRVTMASGEGWSAELKGEWRPISMELKDGTSAVGYVRMVKTATEFAGESG